MTAPPHAEGVPRGLLERRQADRLRTLIGSLASNPFWTRRLSQANLAPEDFDTLDGLRRLPPLTKPELAADQHAAPPYGSNLTFPLPAYVRLHQTSGTTGEPLRWLDTPESWSWFHDCWRIIFRLAGLRDDDRLAFPFSFGPFIGFWAAYDSAVRLGRFCLPLGGMSSEARLSMIVRHGITVVCCTPTYALRLADVAAEKGIDLAGSAVRLLIVAGEPGGNIAGVRDRIEQAWGARVIDHWGMTEIGSLAVEPADDPGSLCVLESECIAEIMDPESLVPAATGEVGELWITNLGRAGSPLLRYRTGDLVRVDPVRPAHAATSLLRLAGGILGRLDDMITVRGNNVFPSTFDAILREFSEIAEYRVTAETRRAMQHLTVELEPCAAPDESTRDALLARVGRVLKDRLHFQVDLLLVEPGTLPRFEMKGRRFVRK